MHGVLASLLGAPAGYALARFAFRGANAYRLMILLTRAFPVGDPGAAADRRASSGSASTTPRSASR